MSSLTNATRFRIFLASFFFFAASVHAQPLAFVVDGQDILVINTQTSSLLGEVETLGTERFNGGISRGTKAEIYATTVGGELAVIDQETYRVLELIPVGDNPAGIAVHPSADRVFVTNFLSHELSVIDTQTRQLIATKTVALQPNMTALSPSGDRLFIAHRALGSVTIIDTTTFEILGSIDDLGLPEGLVVSPDGQILYVADSQRSVHLVSIANSTLVDTIEVGVGPIGLVISPDGSTVFVTNNSSGTVSRIDTAAREVTGEVEVGSFPYGLDITANGDRVFVANDNSTHVSVIDTSDLSVADIEVGGRQLDIAIVPSSCSSDELLCVRDDRFQIEVVWLDFLGNSGFGKVVETESSDSGLFYFFDRNNWEMLVKVLDGCQINNRFWFFAAATTDVGYTVRVTDTLTGVVREYSNTLGVASPAITDTDAFDTCQ